jgi:hypothetical protein
MDDQQRRAAVTEQLAAAKEAHIEYEMTALRGEYDAQWAEWYAHYLLENNWNDLFSAPWDEAELAAALRELDAAHRSKDPDAQWQEFYAGNLLQTR